MTARAGRVEGSSVTAAPARRRARLADRSAATLWVLAAVVLAAGLLGPQRAGHDDTTLRLADQESMAVLFTRGMAVGETFELRHTHSVTRREVVETFSVLDESTLALEELVFDEHGPNLPAGPAHVGEHATYERDGDVVRVTHHGHPIGELPVIVGSEAVDHVVVFEDGERLRLLDALRRGGRAILTVGDEAPGSASR